MEPQVALEQSGSTRAARVRRTRRAFPKELQLSVCRHWDLTAGPFSPSDLSPARRSAPTSLGLTPPTLPEAARPVATLPLYPQLKRVGGQRWGAVMMRFAWRASGTGRI